MQRPTYVTFDCYDTLVDFQGPIERATREVLGPRGDGIDVAEFLRACARLRYEIGLGPYRPYRDVVGGALAEAMRRFGLAYRAEDAAALVAAVPRMQPFPEVPAVLERLRRSCRIAIISNADDDLIAGTVQNIGVPFDRVITAEQARAYKPSLDVFRHALRELGCGADEIVHVAQGFEYDIVPTHALGWARVWINRRGEAGDPTYGPYEELPDLTRLPELIGA